MQNPYYIDDATVIELRDSKGRYSSPSKAKRFYIYHNGQLIFAGEFENVNSRVAQKEIIITQALSDAFESVPYSELVKKEKIQREVIEDNLELELEDQLWKDLVELVEKEEPELLEEIYEAEEAGQQELADELFKDLLEVIAEEEPDLFTEITDVEVPVPGQVYEEYDEFLSYSLGDWRNEEIAQVQKFDFQLDAPITIASKDYNDMIALFDKNLKHPLKQIFESSLDGHRLYLFRMIYDVKVGKDTYSTRGWSVARSEAKTWEDFQYLVVDQMYENFKNKYRNYLARSADGQIIIKGFHLENLYDTESGSF